MSRAANLDTFWCPLLFSSVIRSLCLLYRLQANCSSDHHFYRSRVWLLTCSHVVYIFCDAVADMWDSKVPHSGCRHETTANALRYSDSMSVLLQRPGTAKIGLLTEPSHHLSTVCLACSFALYLLARHPAALEQLLREVDAFGRTRVSALNWLPASMPTKLPCSAASHGQSYLDSNFNADNRERAPASWARCILPLQCMLPGGSHAMVSSIPPAGDSKMPP